MAGAPGRTGDTHPQADDLENLARLTEELMRNYLIRHERFRILP
jgi:hypothetical protein